MSNARKNRKQDNINRRKETEKHLRPIRRRYVAKIRWMNFVAWLKSLFGWG